MKIRQVVFISKLNFNNKLGARITTAPFSKNLVKMKNILFALLCVTLSVSAFAQEIPIDSTKSVQLDDIIIISKPSTLQRKQPKSLTTVDEYLQQSPKVNMVKRGGYAWEPIVNSMATERTIITIDGMRIFGACTDKMDPVTSYVEISNLSQVDIASGQQASCHGATIGGGIDLKRTNYGLKNIGWDGSISSGYETNGSQRILGGAIRYSDSSLYANADVMYRAADNYIAGNNKEVAYSQFSKYNISATAGYLLATNKIIEGSIIFDNATNVGYPALPMDVSSARALINSLRYEYKPFSQNFDKWESKIYYNTITHVMDDTKRKDVIIHMDMPGWSDTFGYYSRLSGTYKKHHFMGNLNGYYNKSLAEMTMYPEDPNENPMFMETWPDIRTLYNGLYIEDKIDVGKSSLLTISAAIGLHSTIIASEMGLASLQIFYPHADETSNRILKSFSTNYTLKSNSFNYSIGFAFGERAPSVSEGFGYYLFNSFDRYDYIGNPLLKNEKSVEGNLAAGYKSKKISINWSGNYFRIQDFIIGKPEATILPMTIGAGGIKKYIALEYAIIANTDLQIEYNFSQIWSAKAQVAYTYGQSAAGENLPFISPLRFSGSIQYRKSGYDIAASASANDVQSKFSTDYGEDKTAAYVVYNLTAGKSFAVVSTKCNLQIGLENIFDKSYSTFSDWNNIPRKGRNLFVNLTVSL